MRRLLTACTAVVLVVSVGCSRQQGDKESFCDLVPQVDDLFSLLRGVDTADAAQVEQRFDEGLAEFRALERAAPREIKPDVAELGNVVEDVLDAVADHPDDRAAIAAELANLTDTHPGAAASALKVIQYTRDRCGVTLDGGPPDAGGTEPSEPAGPDGATSTTGSTETITTPTTG